MRQGLLFYRVEVAPVDWIGAVAVVRISGLLDARSYLQVRHAIVKAATDSPDAVIVVVDDLRAPAGSAWSVLTSASWLLRQWPGIPLVAVSGSSEQRSELVRNGIARYVPIHAAPEHAAAETSGSAANTLVRLRERHCRPRADSAVAQLRNLVATTLEQWQRPECVTSARCVSTVLVENVLRHTDSDIDLRIEARGELITIAVRDDNPAPAMLGETAQMSVSGLAVLSSLSRLWGNSQHADGKTVWVVLGPEDYLAFEI